MEKLHRRKNDHSGTQLYCDNHIRVKEVGWSGVGWGEGRWGGVVVCGVVWGWGEGVGVGS